MKIGSIVIHCYHYEEMMAFWQKALHYIPRETPTDSWVVLTDPMNQGPNISLARMDEPRRGKRSRLHLDLYTKFQKTEVERLINIGARRYAWRYQPEDDFIVLADPDDNLFCVVQLPD